VRICSSFSSARPFNSSALRRPYRISWPKTSAVLSNDSRRGDRYLCDAGESPVHCALLFLIGDQFYALDMGLLNTEHSTCAELGEFSIHNPIHKMRCLIRLCAYLGSRHAPVSRRLLHPHSRDRILLPGIRRSDGQDPHTVQGHTTEGTVYIKGTARA